MPITTPEEVDDKRYSPENTDAPVIEFDGREMTTAEALQIVDRSHGEFWKLIGQLQDEVEEKDETIQTLSNEIASLRERVEELEREEYQCDRCGESLSGDETHCSGCGRELDWEAV